jgi:putative hydrolase of the HAD superfamily
MITTVVFDLDDTLYDEVDYCKSGFASVAGYLAGLPDAPSEERIYSTFWNQFISGDRTKTFNTALDELGIACDDKLINKLIEIYRNHAPQITLPPQSRNVLDQLSVKYTLALLTDGFLPAQQLKVRALRIEKYFKCIIYTEELGREFWKPSPIAFEKLLQILDAKPKNTTYVADNEEKDFIAPNKLGFSTIQIIRPARVHSGSSQQPDTAPQHIIHELAQLRDLLCKL